MALWAFYQRGGTPGAMHTFSGNPKASLRLPSSPLADKAPLEVFFDITVDGQGIGRFPHPKWRLRVIIAPMGGRIEMELFQDVA